ncbi:MAG: hypothetical protein QM783_15810 [Phycisphaerales bacterium]
MRTRQRTANALLDQLVSAARNGPAYFGRGSDGQIVWMLDGFERGLMYRLIAEVGVLPTEVPTLTGADFWLDGPIPHVLLGSFAAPGRSGMMLPLDGAMKAALAEFLQEHEDGVPLFMLGDARRIGEVIARDASIAGVVGANANAVLLAAEFRTGVKSPLVSDDAVEVRP